MRKKKVHGLSRGASWQNPPIKKLVFVTNGIFPVTDRHGVDLLGPIRGAEYRCKSFKINNIKS
jgi:hypothetical protein